jgi:hypothetical protein
MTELMKYLTEQLGIGFTLGIVAEIAPFSHCAVRGWLRGLLPQ